MKQLHIATSPLTGTIFCGTVLKDGNTWGVGKQDLTLDALVAVAEHALHFKDKIGDIIISKADGTPEFKINVERIK